jgi:hypothetical protein
VADWGATSAQLQITTSTSATACGHTSTCSTRACIAYLYL